MIRNVSLAALMLLGVLMLAAPAFAREEDKSYAVTIGCEGAVFTPTVPSGTAPFDRSTLSSSNPGVATATPGRAGMGTDGAITLTGLREGTTTVTYAIRSQYGDYQQNITIRVTVVCPERPRPEHPGPGGNPPGGPNGPGNNQPGGGQPPNGGGPAAGDNFPTFTHRQTNCPACRGLATQLNALIDHYSGLQDTYRQQMANPATRGAAAATRMQMQADLDQIRQLAAQLTDCEQRRCPPPATTPGQTGGLPGTPGSGKPPGADGPSGGTGGTGAGGTGGASTGGGGGNRGGGYGPSRGPDPGQLDGNVEDGRNRPCPPEKRPINVGPNNRVGSSARNRQRATNAVIGALSGLAGGGGGGGRSGPDLVRCRLNDRESTVFSDPATGVALRIGARRTRSGVDVYAGVDASSDSGTFQTAFLENAAGEAQGPRDVGICGLWGEWSLSVSWTRTTYQDGQVVNRESGGWERSGRFSIPGLVSRDGQPDGLWRQLGFSNASHGARQIAMQYRLSPQDLAAGPVAIVIHITRPSTDPVMTVPFVLMMREGPRGFIFERAQDCPPARADAAGRLFASQDPVDQGPAPPRAPVVPLDSLGVVVRALDPV